MNHLRRFFFFFVTIVLVACNENIVFEHHSDSFPDNRWTKENKVEFAPDIQDIASSYGLTLALRHVYGFQSAVMKVAVTTTTPSGKTSTKEYDLQVVGQEGQQLGDCVGDICDLSVQVESGLKFEETGIHKFHVEQMMTPQYVPNVMEFGLILEKQPAK